MTVGELIKFLQDQKCPLDTPVLIPEPGGGYQVSTWAEEAQVIGRPWVEYRYARNNEEGITAILID